MSKKEGVATCPNGHDYPANLAACPWCPKPARSAVVAADVDLEGEARTRAVTPEPTHADKPTVPSSRAAPSGRDPSRTVAEATDGVATHVVGDLTPRQDAQRRTRAIAGEVAAPKRMPIFAWLVVLEGDQQYEEFRIAQEQTYLGVSQTECDIVLHDEFVSAEHASIRYRDGKFYITDLDSKNGTFVNDMSPEARVDRVQLQDGDEIRLGQVLLKFKCL